VNWLYNVDIRRVVQTTNGDFILIDKSLLSPSKNCRVAVNGDTSNAVYVPSVNDSPKDRLLSGILTAYTTGSAIHAIAVVSGASPTYGVTDVGTTSCYIDYFHF
jgi:hypothetical protein